MFETGIAGSSVCAALILIAFFWGISVLDWLFKDSPSGQPVPRFDEQRYNLD